MYCVMRSLCNKNVIQTQRVTQRLLTTRPVASNVIANETFEEKNARLKRPLSPHLSIYKPQITSMLSISHRISGVILFGYAFAIGGCEVFEVTDSVILFLQSLNLSSATWIGVKTLVSMPLTFHIGNGIRHLVWDAGVALTNKGVNITGYGVLALTILLGLGLANL
ncbi:succinate dehydrogenase cytochrome b556 subunit-like [Planococcus citri]|uniref:succinate dehydrogenase cytochrome b556 subunit-like n=1 Tax=Planococcus citri TaxID=170843 RepID=UPI0031F8E95E